MDVQRRVRVNTAVVAALMAPSMVQAAPLTVGGVFFDAAPLNKIIILGLLIATVAALIVCVRKLASGPNLAGGSAFISGLRFGGPLSGFLGASFTGLMMFLGISNSAEPVPFNVMAPGLAEATLLGGLGLLAGAVAVICTWAVEARIDRTVLKS